MQTPVKIRQKKTIWIKLRQCLGLLLFSLILTACGQSSAPQQGVISDDKLSASFPKAITALLVNGSTLIVDVVVNGDTDNPLRVKNLSVNTIAETFSGDVSGVPTGTSTTLSLVYSIIDPVQGTVEVITTSDITVNVVANEDTPADFSSANIFYTDTDGDFISNLDELDAGTNINIANYTVGGQVEGLTGSGLILQNNNSDDLAISADGTFTFSLTITGNGEYSVSVQTEPDSPHQICTVNNGNGTVSGAAVSDVIVICSTVSYTVAGTVSGYTGNSLVLQNNGGDDLVIDANGSFSFATPLTDGSAYAVTVRNPPAKPNQHCTVENGEGFLTGGDANVAVDCQLVLFISADDGVVGRELFITDGTTTGTSLVKDINITTTGSNPDNFIVVNGATYFVTTDPVTGRQLWKTNGTSSGTVMVKNIHPRTSNTPSASLTAMGNTLYFSATDNATGTELWKSDGSEGGTVIVKDMNPNSVVTSNPVPLNVN